MTEETVVLMPQEIARRASAGQLTPAVFDVNMQA
jgi:hypothetical protein